MNIKRNSFAFSVSSTQYNLYKYLVKGEPKYTKKKLYRYKVGDVIYDLFLSSTLNFRYIMTSYFSKKEAEYFKENWESITLDLGLLSDIVNHLKELIHMNSFKKIRLPQELESTLETSESAIADSDVSLRVFWFEEDIPYWMLTNEFKKKNLIIVIFNLQNN